LRVLFDQVKPVPARRAPGGWEAGAAPEMAVAGIPVGVPVALHHVHLDVGGEEVVTGLDALPGRPVRADDVVQEEPARHPLAHEAALEVGEGHDHGVDLVGIDESGQGGQVNGSGGGHGHPLRAVVRAVVGGEVG